MSHFDEHHEHLIDAARAGEASPEQRAEIDRLMRENPDFRAEAELQMRIDRSLMRWSAACDRVMSDAPMLRARSGGRWLALAAAIALLGAGAVIAWQAGLFQGGAGSSSGSGGGGVISPYARLNAEQIYREAEAGRFIPEWRCETDAEFIDAVKSKTARVALLPIDTPGMEIVGWKYSDVTKPAVSSGSMWLYVRTGTGPAVVIVDRLDKDQRAGGLAKGGSSDFHAYRREINGLVLYEITHADQPEIIDQFVVPDPAQES